MRLKLIMGVLVLAGCFYKAEAQQVFAFSEYMQNNFLYNPAASGANDHPSIGATYRKMWAGIDGGPQTFIAFGDKYFAKQKTGVSIAIYSDKTGPTNQTGGQVNLSYSVDFGNQRRLMFGLGGQVLQYGVDKAAIQEALSSGGSVDPLYATLPSSQIKGDAAAGIYYRSPTLNAGFSVEQLIQSSLNFDNNTDPGSKLYRHYYFMADYNWRTDDEDVLIPNALVRYLPNAPVDVEGGVRLEHQDILWIGFGYHYQQSYSAYAGVKINHEFSIGYAYEEFYAPISSFSDGGASNELSLRYYFLK